MSDLCTQRFTELAETLGGVPCHGASPIGYVQDPRHLADGTMPFVELVFVGLAVLTLVHAVRSARRGNVVRLGVWLAAVVYVLVLEPPLYFPKAFGIDDYVPAIFVHNRFTVGFLFDRLPLYILCLYPGMVYLAWIVVERLRLPDRYSGLRLAAVTAVCVGFVHHAFYEIFDMLGPQRRWWAWDFDLPLTQQRVGSVPMSSMVNFALVMPAAFAFLCVLLLQRRPRDGVRSVLLPAFAVGALTPLVSMPGQMPVTILDIVPDFPVPVVVTVLVLMIAGSAVLTVLEFARSSRSARPVDPEDADLRRWVLGLGGSYLAGFAVLWLVALPQTLDAVDGRIPTGQRVGWLPYVLGCFAVATWMLVVQARLRAGRAAEPHVEVAGVV